MKQVRLSSLSVRLDSLTYALHDKSQFTLDRLKRDPSMQATNRRSTARKRARQSVQLHCRRGALGLGADLASEFLDVSEGGVKLIAKELLQPGDEVEIILEGHGLRGPIRRLAEVRWALPIEGAAGCRAGVRFQKLISYRDVQAVSL
jgi:hypothetical protein